MANTMTLLTKPYSFKVFGVFFQLGPLLAAITMFTYLGCKTPVRPLPDRDGLHPIVLRMLNDREKTQNELVHDLFNPGGFLQDTSKGWEPGEKMISFYIKGTQSYSFYYGRVFCIYFSPNGPLKDSLNLYGLNTIIEVFGEPEAKWPSATGHWAREYVYPSHGIVFHTDDGERYFSEVQIFQPTTLRNYKIVHYNDPHFFDPVERGKYPEHHRRYQRPY